MTIEATGKENMGGNLDTADKSMSEPIDWKRVGRVHPAELPLNQVVDREMSRLSRHLETKLNQQHENAMNSTATLLGKK